jgi:A/G-specific adenine glycosylase
MLQQTQVSTVVPYYRRWIRLFPTVEKLALAPLDDVLKAWEGLGYYRRARQMHRAARLIVERRGGRIPESFDELRTLPGVGSCTAAAVASLAFGKDVLAVDGNVRRVAARLFAMKGEATEETVRRALEPCLPRKRAGIFNEAMMELGAVICTPRGPLCGRCPLSACCRAFLSGKVSRYPALPRRKRPPHLKAVALIHSRRGKIFLRRRGESEMLGGLWGFPLIKEGELPGLAGKALAPVRHAYSHFSVTATPLVVREPPARYGGCYFTHEETSRLALSRLDHKILEAWRRKKGV